MKHEEKGDIVYGAFWEKFILCGYFIFILWFFNLFTVVFNLSFPSVFFFLVSFSRWLLLIFLLNSEWQQLFSRLQNCAKNSSRFL